MAEDPVSQILDASRELLRPILAVIKTSNPDAFDAEFTKIEGKLADWKAKFESISRESSDAALTAVSKTGQLMTQLFDALNARSKELGATKGQNLSVAPAAGGKRWKMPRKMSRKYCKKTACRKMGFTQRSSCRPYKNCFTRRGKGRRM